MVIEKLNDLYRKVNEMSKRMLWALLLIGLTVLVLIFNTGRESIDLVLFDVRTVKAVIYLVFLGVGVTIGALLR